MTTLQLYLITKLDSLVELFGGISVVLLVIGGLILMMVVIQIASDDADESTPSFKAWSIRFIIIGFISMIISLAIPSTKEIGFIYMAKYVTNNEHATEIPDKAFKFLNEKMDEYLKDITKESRK